MYPLSLMGSPGFGGMQGKSKVQRGVQGLQLGTSHFGNGMFILI